MTVNQSAPTDFFYQIINRSVESASSTAALDEEYTFSSTKSSERVMEHPWLNHIQNKFSLNPNFNLNSFQEGNSQLVQAPSTSPNAHVQLSPVVRSSNSSPNAGQLLVSGSQSLSTSGMVSSFSEMRIQPPAYSPISRLIEPQRSSPNAQLSPAVRSRNSSPKADQLLASGSQSLSPIEMDSFFSGMSSFVQLPVCSPGSQLVQTPNSSPLHSYHLWLFPDEVIKFVATVKPRRLLCGGEVKMANSFVTLVACTTNYTIEIVRRKCVRIPSRPEIATNQKMLIANRRATTAHLKLFLLVPPGPSFTILPPGSLMFNQGTPF
ncbi:hypothetical protein TNCT_730601 [Trichonephila clavata]|uniref:Uncharacterized protein n=1 Tax=Trichonephila clavata TaxID=2740835 RepID=A0A8X6FMT7_TRICU|nr:hypothetical protein TNCT_730601 [Trichonephila clavata]